MNAVRLMLTGLFLACLAMSPALAQRVQPKRAQELKGRLGVSQTPLLPAEALEKLKLSAEQKEKYARIEGEYRDKQKAAQEKFREELKVRDREKIKEALQKMQSDSQKLRTDQLAKVETLLTAEQKKTFAEVKQEQPGRGGFPAPGIRIGAPGIGQILPPQIQLRLNLSDEQKKKIEDLQKEVEAKVLNVLTDEQKKQYEQLKKGQPLRRPQPNNNQSRKPILDREENSLALVATRRD